MYEYAESSAQTFAKCVAVAERDGKPTFSFSTLYNCELNPAQTTVMEDLMNDCAEDIYDGIYRKRKVALNVEGLHWEDVNVHHPALSINHLSPFLYEHLAINKQGITGRGDDRWRRYIKKWLKDGNLGSPPIVRGIAFHNVLPHIQREVVDAMTASF